MNKCRPFRKLLVANRGEIAVRVIRACRTLGIRSVAVYSEQDRDARHTALADEAVLIGDSPALASYLRPEKLLAAAASTGAEAIHPGFGFLSENAAFATAVEEAGLVWVGPPPSAMEAMGRKIESRERMQKASVPVVPGTHQVDDPKEWERVGFPAVVKASSGGGGKGMRVVRSAKALPDAIAACRREAEAAFGDGTVYLERYLERPRHVEVQVFGDSAGTIATIGERDCSLQRRHQKVIEESPSPAVSPDLRNRLCQAAAAAARAVGYRNAGTIEFLLAASGEFFFLEMNTRLQVEHGVTEEAFGVDLVALQLAVAQGDMLPPGLPSSPSGFAMEARIYAEDPDGGFLPQTGRILLYREPSGPGIRVDSGICEGMEVSVYYDPMLAKLIARGATRDEARRRLHTALGEMVILGVQTNISYLRRVLETPEFSAGEADTGFLERTPLAATSEPDEAIFAAAASAFSSPDSASSGFSSTSGAGRGSGFVDPLASGKFRMAS